MYTTPAAMNSVSFSMEWFTMCITAPLAGTWPSSPSSIAMATPTVM